MVMNKEEIKAIENKLNNPKEKVLCPRCGAELQYFEYGNSSKAYCHNDEDVKGTIRGI